MNTIETKIGIFEVIKDEQQSLNIVDLEKKYVEILNKYEFLVGDYFQENLRLKGFNRENLNRIPDYINEYCALDSNYYILRNPKFNKDYVVEEE